MPRFLLKFFPGQLDLHTLAVVAVNNRGPRPARELDLRGQRPALQVLVTLQIQQRVLAVRAIEFLRHVIHDHVIPVLAAESVIAVGRQHLDPLPLDPHDGDVERAPAQIEDENRLVFVEFVEAVSHGGGGRFVDDLENVEPGQLSRGDCRRPFGVVKIGRHRDDRIGHRFLEILLRIRLQLAQNQGRKFLRRINLPVEFALKLPLRFAHLALHEIHDPFRFRDRVVLGQAADDDARAIEQDHGRSEPLALAIRNDLRFAVGIDMGHGAERRAEIDSDYFSSSYGLSHSAVRRSVGFLHPA